MMETFSTPDWNSTNNFSQSISNIRVQDSKHVDIFYFQNSPQMVKNLHNFYHTKMSGFFFKKNSFSVHLHLSKNYPKLRKKSPKI